MVLFIGLGIGLRTAFRVFLVICILGLSWFEFGQQRDFDELAQRLVDNFDSRPARQILLLGNSRTYYNQMPQMLREIADSAGSPEKYQVTAEFPAGSSLESLWEDSRTQSLLKSNWDDAVVQGESRAFSDAALLKSFIDYGPKLLMAIKLKRGQPNLVVNWSYDSTSENPLTEAQRTIYQADIDKGHAFVAMLANARLVRLSSVWNDVRRDHPEIKLTVDGNHPTLAGSYLYALMLYSDLSQGGVSRVSFVPDGLSNETASIMKDAIDRNSPVAWTSRGALVSTTAR